MNKKIFWLSLVAIIVSFASGFLLANALNRREMDDLRTEVGRLKDAPPPSEEKDAQTTLSDDEIRQKIAEADSNSDNIEFQKDLAMALYRYASMKQEAKWLPEVVKLLNRVNEKKPKDYNTLITLGDVYFDFAQNAARENSVEDLNKNIEQSREFYRKALVINPADAQLQTDFGATYLFSNPPDNEKAAAAFQKSLQTNPRNEKTLEFIVRAFQNQAKTKEAKNFFEKLKEINPKNEALPELETKLSESGENQ